MDFFELLFLVLPAYASNSIPVVLGGGTKIDLGKNFFDGKRVFGDSKTIRGFISGVAAGTLVGVILALGVGFLPWIPQNDKFVVGFLVSLGYWIIFFAFHALPHFGDLIARMGGEVGYALRTGSAWRTYVRAGALAGAIWFLFRRRMPAVAVYGIAILLPIAAVLNIQLLIGVNPQPDHWHRVQFLPIAFAFLLLGSAAYGHLKGKTQQMFRTITYAGAIFILGAGIGSQVAWSKAQAYRYTLDPTRSAAYAWLNTHVPRDTVLGSASLRVVGELNLYTHVKPFVPNGFHTTVSDEELWERFMYLHRLAGTTSEQFDTLIQDPAILLYLFHDTYRDRSFDSYFRDVGARTLPEDERRRRMDEYASLLHEPIPEKIPYALHYVMTDTSRDAEEELSPELRSRLTSVYAEGQVRIYEFR